MQTFLPYANLSESAQALDSKRLGKQRIEALQIYQALTEGSRWENHPAVIMWRGYEHILACYHNYCIEEWVRRGFNNTMDMLSPNPVPNSPWKHLRTAAYPWWWGCSQFHDSHKSNLLRKDFDYYDDNHKWYTDLKVDDDWLYLWPLFDRKIFRVTLPKWTEYRDYHIPLTPFPIWTHKEWLTFKNRKK